jgi:hypothetical protein
MNKPKVLVTLLTGIERQNWINPELTLMLFDMGRDPRFDVRVALIKDCRPFEVARNNTIKLARDNNFDYLVSFDNDVFLPVGGPTPLDVIAAAGDDQSVIGLTCGIKSEENGYRLHPPLGSAGRCDGAFREVPNVGGGCLIVSRKVWKKIPRGPWFVWDTTGGDAETLDISRSGLMSEDNYFCRLVRQRGFTVWTHTQILASHYRSVDLTTMVCTMAQMSGRG